VQSQRILHRQHRYGAAGENARAIHPCGHVYPPLLDSLKSSQIVLKHARLAILAYLRTCPLQLCWVFTDRLAGSQTPTISAPGGGQGRGAHGQCSRSPGSATSATNGSTTLSKEARHASPTQRSFCLVDAFSSSGVWPQLGRRR